MISQLNNIKGIIFDVDGTLIQGGQALPGAAQTLNQLRQQGIVLRFASNTTGRNPEQIAKELNTLGIQAYANEIQTSVTACKHYIDKHLADKKGFIAVPDRTANMLTGITQTEDKPDFVVIGDLDEGFNYPILNKLFNYVYNGAQLIAFHRNPFCTRDGHKQLDSGAFTLAFEAICDQQAVITGKPSPELFNTSVDSMSLSKEQVIVVGDDVTTDIAGAINAGIRSILVGTGKYQAEHLQAKYPQADAFVENLNELVNC